MRIKRTVLALSFAAASVASLPSVAQASSPPAVTDTKAPVVKLVSPAANAIYKKGASVKASYSCSDTGGSGLASCTGTFPNGAYLPTETTGTKDFKVWATDGAGNMTKVVRTYKVV